jgi:hypothetical protein
MYLCINIRASLFFVKREEEKERERRFLFLVLYSLKSVPIFDLAH